MKNIFSTIAILFLATNLFAAAWTGATSEPENMKKIDGKPFYVITNADELAWFAAKVNAGETAINAMLANDIVFGADTSSSSSTIWTMINSFGGIIDGNGFTIYGLYLRSKSKSEGAYFIKNIAGNGILRSLQIKNWDADNVHWDNGNDQPAGFIKENNGKIENVVNWISFNTYAGGPIETNNGSISKFINYGNHRSGGNEGGIVAINNGTISHSINYGLISTYYGKAILGGIATTNGKNGIIEYCIHNGNAPFVSDNQGKIVFCINNNESGESSRFYQSGTNYAGYSNNTGSIRSSYGRNFTYFLNNTEVSSTAEKMQTDQFAWILNTSNGAEENSGVWTRGTDGYPTWANEDSLAIRKVVFDDDGTTSNRYTNYKGQVSFPENPKPAEGYIFSGWYNADEIKVKPTTVFTADQTVKAVYTDASDVFWTINFYNAAPADTVLESKSYQHGSIVTYGGAEPTLASTAQYSYTFKGWDVEPTNAVEDFDYHAIYDSTVRSYAITFNNSDGSKIESATFEYGKMPSCSKTPTRDATAEWKYAHKGWKPALDSVTEAATYTAIYDSSKVEYKVTFMNGATVIDEQMVPYGDAAVAPTNVTREGYKFVGWNTSFVKVTEALTVKALFEELIVRSISVVNADGEKIDSAKVEDGETYTLPEAPKKDGYTFDAYYNGDKKLGVAGDEISVTANITITAKYIQNPKSSSSQQEIASSSSTPRNDELSSSSSRNDKSSSSSSKVKSSSSSRIKSSSSTKTEAIVASVVPQFSVQVMGRNLQISSARIGATYALFDMQGRVLLQGRVQMANFEIPVAHSGDCLIRVGNNVQRIAVK